MDKIRAVGQTIVSSGYITTIGSIIANGSTPAEVERSVGYKPGSLPDGYWLLRLSETELIKEGDFEFRGYSHFEDGVPTGNKSNVWETFDNQYTSSPIDQDTKRKVLKEGLQRLNRRGVHRVARVVPIFDNRSYEPGAGIVQDKLIEPKSFDVVARVERGQSVRRTPDDRIEIVVS